MTLTPSLSIRWGEGVRRTGEGYSCRIEGQAVSRADGIRALQPAGLLQKLNQPRVLRRQRWQPETQFFPFPKVALGISGRYKLVAIKHCANVMRWFIGKWIAAEQAQSTGIVVEQFPDQVQRPGILVRRAHRRKPH